MKNDDKNRLIIGLTSIFVYFFFNLFSSSLLSLIGINVKNLSKTKSMIISLGVSIVVLIILFLINKKRLSKNLKDYKKNYKVLIKRNFKYWMCAIFIMFVTNIAIALIFNRITSANDQGIREIFNVFPLYIVLEAMILAPFTEELIFRESIRNIFKNKYLFIIISGLLFGFMHTLASLENLADYLYIIPYSVPGFFFAYMLYEEDNVLVPITFHAFHNSIAIVLLLLSKILGIM